jgi:hypothetical protein
MLKSACFVGKEARTVDGKPLVAALVIQPNGETEFLRLGRRWYCSRWYAVEQSLEFLRLTASLPPKHSVGRNPGAFLRLQHAKNVLRCELEVLFQTFGQL